MHKTSTTTYFVADETDEDTIEMYSTDKDNETYEIGSGEIDKDNETYNVGSGENDDPNAQDETVENQENQETTKAETSYFTKHISNTPALTLITSLSTNAGPTSAPMSTETSKTAYETEYETMTNMSTTTMTNMSTPTLTNMSTPTMTNMYTPTMTNRPTPTMTSTPKSYLELTTTQKENIDSSLPNKDLSRIYPKSSSIGIHVVAFYILWGLWGTSKELNCQYQLSLNKQATFDLSLS